MLEKRPAGADAARESGQRRSMKIASRILLGTASGLAMVAGAQAADLGDKAEPVQFVKICTVDGHSYYYIPGNDVCTKNGLSLTIGTDERRSKSLMNLSGVDMPKIGGQPNDRRGEAWPDPFISLRTDQAWGYGALVGGAHNIHAPYSGDNSALGSPALSGLGACLQPGTLDCGRANDKAGFFMALGGEVKVPIFGAGDRIGAGVRYSQGGSSGFGGGANLSAPDLFGAAGNNLTAGWMPDAGAGSGIELTTAWSVQAGYDHQWSPSLNTSLFAGYSNVTYDADTASTFAGAVCGSPGSGAAAQAGISCKSNWGNVGAGLRTSWAPATGLTLSVQTMYNYVWSGFNGTGNVFGGAPAVRPAESYNFANQGVWSSYLRINHTFNTGN
jgi:Porin subfamily